MWTHWSLPPDPETLVLAFLPGIESVVNDQVVIAYIHRNGMWYDAAYHKPIYGVSHWMAIPAAPERTR